MKRDSISSRHAFIKGRGVLAAPQHLTDSEAILWVSEKYREQEILCQYSRWEVVPFVPGVNDDSRVAGFVYNVIECMPVVQNGPDDIEANGTRHYARCCYLALRKLVHGFTRQKPLRCDFRTLLDLSKEYQSPQSCSHPRLTCDDHLALYCALRGRWLGLDRVLFLAQDNSVPSNGSSPFVAWERPSGVNDNDGYGALAGTAVVRWCEYGGDAQSFYELTLPMLPLPDHEWTVLENAFVYREKMDGTMLQYYSHYFHIGYSVLGRARWGNFVDRMASWFVSPNFKGGSTTHARAFRVCLDREIVKLAPSYPALMPMCFRP